MNMLVSATAAAASSTVIPAELQASDQALVAVADLAIAGESLCPRQIRKLLTLRRILIGETRQRSLANYLRFCHSKVSRSKCFALHRKGIEIIDNLRRRQRRPGSQRWMTTAQSRIELFGAILSAARGYPQGATAQSISRLKSNVSKPIRSRVLNVDDIVKLI